MTDTGKPALGPLDIERERLRACYPGWNIWYVPNALNGSVTWCAQPGPLVNCDSPEELARAIEAAGR